MKESKIIDMTPGDGDDEFEFRERKEKPSAITPLKAKLIFWGVIGGSIAIGTIVFLTFISLFVYFFVPIMVIVGIWTLLKYLNRH